METKKHGAEIDRKISPGIYTKLYKLFEEKKWEVSQECTASTFERYCRTLCLLDDKQQSFLLDLSKDFLHIPFTDYISNLVPAINNLISDFPHCKNIYFTCCLPEKDIGKIKSQTFVFYLFKGGTLNQKTDFKNKKHLAVEDISIYKKKSFEDEIIVLVDDFIGTGKTASDAIDYVRKELPQLKDNSKIIIMTIVALEQGINFLSKSGVKTYAAHVVKKGITDKYTGSLLKEATDCMNGIEKKIPHLKPDYKFGYKQSEALVSMERCPNNTFPIYWLTKDDAPYGR